MINPWLQRGLAAAAARQDLMIVVLLVTAIMMMILPLPTLAVDFLLASNMAFTVLMLMVAAYLRTPLDFSVLPSVILIATVFRLALSISTTRLILLQADAGRIVQTFGEFVVGGNLVVGLVIFLIITIVQFVVITKGSERVAEVAARFTLDALPGKQMSIDGELRNGDIDQAEATRRRRVLEKESQLYGAMDGTMKFVKGDAIAGLVIIAINLLGGIAVGMVQKGLSLNEAMRLYSLLTIGDGLVMQIPALFLSITAGTIVTRVTTEDSSNLGADIARQLGRDPQVLLLAAAVLVVLSTVPGFPTLIFLMLAAAFASPALISRLRRRAAAADAAVVVRDDGSAVFTVSESGDEAMMVRLAPDLAAALPQADIAAACRSAPADLAHELGIPLPEVGVIVDDGLAENRFLMLVDGVPVQEGMLLPGHVLLRDEPAHLDLLGIEAVERGPVPGEATALWVEARHVPELMKAGIGHAGPGEVLASALARTARRYAAHFIGIEETQALLQKVGATRRDLVREVQGTVSVHKTADVIRRLLDEGVSVRNHRLVLEALVEWGQKEQDVVLLAEYVRAALKRQICHAHADARKVIFALILERGVEEDLRGAIRQTTVGSYLTLGDGAGERVVQAIRRHLARSRSAGGSPVALTSIDIRRFLRAMLLKNGVDVPVISYSELAPEFTVQPVAVVRVPIGNSTGRDGVPDDALAAASAAE
ncbi:MAG TPA: type III secretion system export apparatus subunit SctV [Alphaproteobacteria bacterium]|nr:type III secretion system export apparatus subunit SctV [Alphaproteobacteria bacterium]